MDSPSGSAVSLLVPHGIPQRFCGSPLCDFVVSSKGSLEVLNGGLYSLSGMIFYTFLSPYYINIYSFVYAS